jgi:hypothetical protein
MTTLKDIKGDQIRYLDEDPVVQGLAGGTWASGGSLNTGRYAYGGDGGTSGAAFVAGASTGTPPYVTTHEQYNGTTWTTSTSMSTVRSSGGAGGTTTAAFVATGRTGPGSVTANTELWNGSTWTEVNDVNSAGFSVGSGIGTQTAGLIGARTTTTSIVDATESWNGTSWTELGTYPGTASEGIQIFGTYTLAIFAGGYGGSVPRGGDGLYKDEAYEWNGSTYSSETNLPAIRASGGSVGTTTDGLVSGGWEGSVPAGGNTTNTTHYDGTTWTELNNLSTAGSSWGSSKGGTTSDTIVFGGGNANTEEWATAPSASIGLQEGMLWFNSTSQTLKGYGTAAGIPAGTWASGGNLPSPTSQNASSGASTSSALNFGGTNTSPSPTSQIALTQTYDGTAWTEVNDLNTARRYLQGSGTQTSSLAYGGFTSPTSYMTNTESWDGTNWTAVSALNNAAGEAEGFGLSATSAVMAGANPSGRSPSTEQWNGSSWTAVASQNTFRIRYAASGAATDGIISFGETPGSPSASAETWNGTSWTTVTSGNTARYLVGGSGGSSNSALSFGGTPPVTGKTEFWNGTSWTELNDMSTARLLDTGSGHTAASSLAVGGATPTISNATEEFTATAAVTTITTS